jgi:transposase-like protein
VSGKKRKKGGKMSREEFGFIKDAAIEEVLQKYFTEGLEPARKAAMKQLLEIALDEIMKSERRVFLRRDTNNKGNGYYPRTLTAGSWKLDIEVPRDRKGQFRPHVLPDPYKRTEHSYVDLLMSLVANGYSESQLMRSLHELGLPYSEDEMTRIRDELIERLNDFKGRELPEEAFALFIDGYHTEIKESRKIRKACVYTVMGIDLEGRKDVYGFYTFFGNENKGDWLKVLNDLIERGLKRVIVIISDDFPGLTEAVKALYPLTEHQLCYVHLQRNVRRHMSSRDASAFNKELANIKLSKGFEEGKDRFEALCRQYRDDYPTFIKEISQKTEHYLCFLRYPDELRKHIYTTNAVESLNSKVELIRMKLGGYFQSVSILEINMMLQVDRLKRGKWRKPVPLVRARAYEILQLFNMKFHVQTQDS